MSDWVDDLFVKAEGIGFLHDIAVKLKFAYDVWRQTPADAGPVQTQAHNLQTLYQRATTLKETFNESLLTLQQSWAGDEADIYLGPMVTAFQVEHDMEPSTNGVGYQLYVNLAGTTDLLNYNGGAHTSIAQTLSKIHDLHDTLNTAVWESVALLGADVAEAAVPGAEELDIATVPLTAARAGEAFTDAEEVVEIAQVVKGVEDIQTVARVAPWVIALVSVGGVALVGVSLLAWHLINDHHSSQQPPTPRNYYPPGIAGNPLKERQYDNYLTKYGDPLLAEYLVNSGLDPTEIDELVRIYGITPLAALAKLLKTNAWGLGSAAAFRNLYDARNLVGITTVLNDILRSNSQSGLKGGLFELSWYASNVANITQVQLPGRDRLGRLVKGPDARLSSGTLVQLKSFTWGPNYNSTNIKMITDQVTSTRRTYPTDPIVFIFDSTGKNVPGKTMQCLPDNVIAKLKAAGIYPAGTPGASITWDYWPPGNCAPPIP